VSELRDRVALVTGASSGIGFHVAVELAREGAKVALFARRKDRLEACRQAILAVRADAPVQVVPGDVTDRADVERAVASTVKQWQAIDVLVNNAGVGLFGSVLGTRVEDVRRVMEINVIGVLHVLQAVLPGMLARNRGHVVNVSSFIGEKALPGFGPYCASKAAVNLLTEALAFELAGTAIRVTTVQPGTTDTEFVEAAICSNCERRAKVHKGQPPEAAARAIVRAIRSDRRRLTLTAKALAITCLNRLSRRLADRVVRWVKRDEIRAYAREFLTGRER